MKVNRYVLNAEEYTSPGWAKEVEKSRLGMNEGYYLSPHVIETLRGIDPSLARFYPPGELPQLKAAIREHYGVPDDVEILLFPGSDNGIDTIIRTFSEPGDSIVMRNPEYGNTRLFAEAHGLQIKWITPKNPAKITPEEISAGASSPDVAIVYFSNPHNPTGDYLHPELIAQLKTNALIVVDEAYIHFQDITFKGAIELISTNPNIVITRTFSKLFGLAGLRLGVVFASKKHTAGYLRKLQRTKDLTLWSQMAAMAALEDIESYRSVAREIMTTRDMVAAAIEQMGYPVISGGGNFLMFKPPCNPELVFSRMKEKGYILRYYTEGPFSGWVRTTVWDRETMEGFLKNLKGVLKECGA